MTLPPPIERTNVVPFRRGGQRVRYRRRHPVRKLLLPFLGAVVIVGLPLWSVTWLWTTPRMALDEIRIDRGHRGARCRRAEGGGEPGAVTVGARSARTTAWPQPPALAAGGRRRASGRASVGEVGAVAQRAAGPVAGRGPRASGGGLAARRRRAGLPGRPRASDRADAPGGRRGGPDAHPPCGGGGVGRRRHGRGKHRTARRPRGCLGPGWRDSFDPEGLVLGPFRDRGSRRAGLPFDYEASFRFHCWYAPVPWRSEFAGSKHWCRRSSPGMAGWLLSTCVSRGESSSNHSPARPLRASIRRRRHERVATRVRSWPDKKTTSWASTSVRRTCAC